MQEKEEIKRLGKVLADLREERGLTKYRIAKGAKIDQNTISRIERGDLNFGVRHLMSYLKQFDIDLVKLLKKRAINEFLTQK